MKCNVCGQDNPAEAGFCGNCGAALVTAVEPPSPAAVPGVPVAPPAVAAEYAGFWIRFGATIIDAIAVGVVSALFSFQAFRFMALGGIFLPVLLLYHWLFTGLRGQTLGKMALRIKVVNAEGNKPGLGYAALREILGKLISTIAVCVGFLWIVWDREKQSWHDKIASTYVVRAKSKEEEEKGL